MAKTLEDVNDSRHQREEIADLFGGVIPESILRHNPSDRAKDLLVEEQGRDYESTFHQPKETAKQFGDVKDSERQKHLYQLSGSGARWGALSRFPQNVGRILLKLLSKRGDTVVDPFAGHNSRMELCWRAHRHYVGCDISKVFMAANFELRRQMLQAIASSMFKDKLCTIELHECDSRKIDAPCRCVLDADGQPIERAQHIKNNTGDFTITSPPYWCLEDYGDEMGQLGKNDYHNFLIGLGMVAKQNFRCLKSGAFCVWCVNDFRYEGKFYPYHMHTAQLLRDAGFKQHDIAIIDLGTSMRAAFAKQILSQRILPKRHEYALIFVKP
jgi:hypothetical protein